MPRSLAMEILSALASAHRAGAHRDHDGPDGEREFKIGEFERLEVAGPFDVEVETGGSPSVRASGPEWALENLSVEHEDDRLFIGCDGDCDGDVRIVVTVGQLQAVRSSGSGDISIDRIKGELFECTSSGSGDLAIDEIKVDRLKLSAAGSGDIRIDKLRATEFETTLMGSGDLSVVAVESAEF